MTTEHPARLDALLARSAQTHPDRTALEGAGESWTYARLDRAVDVLAARLTAAGVAPGDRVGVYAPKSPATVIALYAALRAGAVAAPLDTADPPERTARMIRNAGLFLLLASDRALAGAHRAAALVRDGAPADEGALDHGLHWLRVLAPEERPAPTGGGYILFTSGSTGWPKGVLLSHENVAHYALWAAREFGLTPDDRIGSQAALTFDLTTFDLFSAAATGACTVLMPDLLRAFPRDVVDWLTEQRITHFIAVPSLYHGMLQQGGIADARPSALRLAAFGGESFAPELLERYLRLLDGVPFYNLYGPTETNACTYYRVPADWTADQELTIGRSIGEVHIEVLDEDGRPTDGEGEIHIAGPTVFQGYLCGGEPSDPTRTVTFRDGVARRAYASGDIGRITPDGRVFLRGRRDSQVKRRGHRIDLLDVESAVLDLPQVPTAVVVAKNAPYSGQIWAYAQTDATERDVLAALRDVLPKRMLPDRIVPVATLPTTTSGKVDRRALSDATGPAHLEEIPS
ncbi:amino acid adenylation domain-containing protein [Streptomyces sp. NBC_01005]|uniref:amino acid adenylation domain-containing protein n=1 Tax=unclassified Streptomyces TaxID=2593676 RepID=UPI002E38235B|nr:amino acid adenylation domain-containing protein [Streptomyces sp. NBC_01362]WSW03107.1 amino acid adenylation domain-containing protein [Streptomyces sp. NBC_01005]WTC92613.1 amino acid adenylation domain-containing protein [Streptomyces sp. NBC_01650]